MSDKLRSGKTRIVIMLSVFVVVLALVGVLMSVKMQTLMHGHVEKQLAEQAKVLAELLEESMDSQLIDLENIAVYIENNVGNMEVLMDVTEKTSGQAAWGILELGGNALYGEVLHSYDFAGIQDSFRGNKSVSYKEGVGMLFTVPIFHNGNVKYVLYKLVDEALLLKQFGMSFYDGRGRVLVATRDGEIVIPYMDWKDEDLAFLKGSEVTKCFAEISDRMNISSAAAVCYREKGETRYLLVAEVGEYDFLLVGDVDENVAGEGLSYIVTLVLWVFGLLLLLLAIGMSFLFGAEEKARESDELRREKELADIANRAKSDFLANMSHEIRTPINAVMGMNEMILRECEDEEIREYAFNVQNASKTLLSLVNDILDLSKIEAGKMEIVEDNYHLSSVLNNVVNMIQIRADEKKLALHMKVDETIPDNLFGDEVRIRQIMVNLLSNAVKYTKAGSVWLYVEKEKSTQKEMMLKIAVKDTGIGIREEDMEKLFSDFERLNQKENHNIEGTGLGLSITSKLVQLMKGRMEVESVYGEGSTFTVYLPQRVVGEECIGNFEEKYQEYIQSTRIYKESFKAPEASVLVVDDYDMNLLVVEKLLRKTEVCVTCCGSGEKCLELVKEKQFDVIFLDHMMPGMDGIETMKRLKEMEGNLSKAAPIIALTANAILGVQEMYLGEGFDDYLSKPIDSPKLEELLRKYLPKEKLVYERTKGNSREGKEKVASVSAAEENASLIELAIGFQYCAYSEEMYREFLTMFVDFSTEKSEQIEAAYVQEDWANMAIYVHALKSGSLTIGGKCLSEAAAAREKACKDGDTKYVKAHQEALMTLYRATVEAGRSILAQEKISVS